ncbi:HAD family hydrolase [Streptomyces phytohabitans]|uniref:HAD family hydrolase n=1 Tax=Streptomyces phytohabitans TaxID=1150371 RepID=UPI00345BF3D2
MSPSLPVPVIFDLDGTLVDSEPHYFAAARTVLAAHGVPGFTWEEHERFIGIGTRETVETLRARYGISAPVDALLAEKNTAYLALARSSAQVYAPMQQLVERLHAGGHPLAVASGSSRTAIDAVLSDTALDRLLPVRVSAEDVGRGKPAPDVFLEAARLLDAAPADCVVVEDAPPGVEAARRAGMRCVAVPYAPGAAGDAAFASAGLVFPGGQAEFDPGRAYDWVRQAGSGR